MTKSDQSAQGSSEDTQSHNAADSDSPARIPLVSEQLEVGKHRVVTGRVRVTTSVECQEVPVSNELRHDAVDIQRVPIGRVVETVPVVREEGNVTVIPVLEEILVVEKRLLLKEEIHVRRQATTTKAEQTVTLRKQRADIERE